MFENVVNFGEDCKWAGKKDARECCGFGSLGLQWVGEGEIAFVGQLVANEFVYIFVALDVERVHRVCFSSLFCNIHVADSHKLKGLIQNPKTCEEDVSGAFQLMAGGQMVTSLWAFGSLAFEK